MHDTKPSEALFVRTILPFCTKIGPMWLKNAALLRQQRRDKKHRTKKLSKKFKKDTNSDDEEVLLCVTLLRKLYREIKPSCIGDLMRSWIHRSSCHDNSKCVVTRGDARGRMRRIDGGRGPDKVWRLDVLIALLYHGLPLASSDNGIIIHSCQNNLCIRPQHLRFKASSISLALTLKILKQSGYTIINNQKSISINNHNGNIDENVDLSGPFTIEELEKLTNEQVQFNSLDNCKLNSGPEDIYILEKEGRLKEHFMKYLSVPKLSKNEEIDLQIKKCGINSEIISKVYNEETLDVTNSDTESQDTIPETNEDKELIDILSSVNIVKSTDNKQSILNKEDGRDGNNVGMDCWNTSLLLTSVVNGECFDGPSSSHCDLRTSSVLSRDMIPTASITSCPYSDKRLSSEARFLRDDDHMLPEFYDMLYSMRPNQYKRDSSIKITTPHIFSPSSDCEENE